MRLASKTLYSDCLYDVSCFSFVCDKVDRLFADSLIPTCNTQSQSIRIVEIGDSLRTISVVLKIKYKVFWFPTKWKTRVQERSIVVFSSASVDVIVDKRGLQPFRHPLSVTCTSVFWAGCRYYLFALTENANAFAKELSDWMIKFPPCIEESNMSWV